MPTFLPFLRAVKAPATPLAVCALIFASGTNCLTSGRPHESASPATGPLATALNNESPKPVASTADTAPNAPPAESDAGEAPSAAKALPQISIDLPYPHDGRPRAPDPVQAAAEDEELARWNLGGSSDPNSASSQGSYHPSTRVVVDTRAAKRRAGARPLPAPRGLTYQLVQAQTRSQGYWPFRLCFELGQRDKKGSGGETRVAFTINTRGKVRAARLLDSKLGNAASASCMVREVLKLTFAPAPPSILRMVATIKVYPGDAEQPVAPDAAAVASLARAEFDPEAARACIAAKQTELAACFNEARRADPALWGRLALSVILEMDGSVHRVSEVESHFPNAAAARCAQALVSTVIFPSVNGKPFSFVLPLRLSPNTALQKETGPDESPSPSDGSDDPSAD